MPRWKNKQVWKKPNTFEKQNKTSLNQKQKLLKKNISCCAGALNYALTQITLKTPDARCTIMDERAAWEHDLFTRKDANECDRCPLNSSQMAHNAQRVRATNKRRASAMRDNSKNLDHTRKSLKQVIYTWSLTLVKKLNLFEQKDPFEKTKQTSSLPHQKNPCKKTPCEKKIEKNIQKQHKTLAKKTCKKQKT